MQWMGSQAVVTLPEHIDRSNVGCVREQLLWVINRGAAVLVADLTGTVSCDYSGADALARAHHRAAANGTKLRLAVLADVVRRVLSLSGLDRLVSVYPTVDGAIAAGDDRPRVPGEPATAATAPAGPDPAGLAQAADPAGRAGELPDWVVSSILDVGVSLQAAVDMPRDITDQRITDARRRLDDVVREIRDDVAAGRGQGTRPDPARRPLPEARERSARVRDRSALLRQRVAHTAHAVHLAAADTAALLERRADLLGQPGRIDYPTEIKRWRVFADEAQQMAERWEQRP